MENRNYALKYERALLRILERYKVPNTGKFIGANDPVFMIVAKALDLEINNNSVYLKLNNKKP